MKRVLAVLLIVAAVVGVFLAYRGGYLDPTAPARAAAQLGLIGADPQGVAGPLTATGIVEAHRVTLSSELGGRVAALLVAEGDSVTAGQPLATLDDRLLRAAMAQADAAVAEAEAQVNVLLAGARAEEIDQANALVAQAETGVEVAQQALEDAVRLRDNPQEMDLRIVEAEGALAKAQHQAKAARLQAEAADLQTALWGRITSLLAEGFDVPLPTGATLHVNNPAERDRANTQWNVSGQQAWEAWQGAYAADEAVRAAKTALADLRRQRATPISADAAVNQATAAVRQAEAAVDQARAGLQALEEGARPEQIEVARRAVDQARAARAALDVQLAKTRITAPQDGLVTQVYAHAGEVAGPGTPLLELADLSEVTVTVYVPEPDLGRVHLGQAVQVTVDSFPGRTFAGRVTHIADKAEFTPKNVQTRQERVNTVFAVKITAPNPEHALKPGMPADVTFDAEGRGD